MHAKYNWKHHIKIFRQYVINFITCALLLNIKKQLYQLKIQFQLNLIRRTINQLKHLTSVSNKIPECIRAISLMEIR